MTTRFWNATYGDFGTAADWMPYGAIRADDSAIINGTTVSAGEIPPGRIVQVNAGPSSSNAAGLSITDGTIDVGARVILTASNFGSVTFQSNGLVFNAGLIKFQQQAGATGLTYGTLSIRSGNGRAGSLTNTSVIQLAARDVLVEGALVNSGSIILSNPAQDAAMYSLGDFEGVVSGLGAIHIGPGTRADFNSPVGSGQTVSFEPGSGLAPAAVVERPESFAATFANFTAASSILLSTPNYDGTQISASAGLTTLTFTKAGTNVATLRFRGTYTSDQLTLAPVPNGTTLTTTTITTTQQAVTDPGPVINEVPGLPVFRFFDTRLGTHFFTADVNEVGKIQRTQPDLTLEGVSLHAVNPVADDPDAAPVYRFFDSIAGTHFFTASESEKATVIATRPDLVFEPSSVFSEHLTAQSGDVAVYRYFDSIHGTHFYTSDATEQAGIAAGRPDLIAEGIGFYAPAN